MRLRTLAARAGSGSPADQLRAAQPATVCRAQRPMTQRSGCGKALQVCVAGTAVCTSGLGWKRQAIRSARQFCRCAQCSGMGTPARRVVANHGSSAEFVAMRAVEVAMKRSTTSHTEAGGLALAGFTAWEDLVAVGQRTPGQRVLVHATAGGVDSLAVQIAKAHGAHVMGAASVVHRVLVRSRRADCIQLNATLLKALAQQVDRHQLRPVIGAEFALNDIRQAYALGETRYAKGKIALYVGQPSVVSGQAPACRPARTRQPWSLLRQAPCQPQARALNRRVGCLPMS